MISIRSVPVRLALCALAGAILFGLGVKARTTGEIVIDRDSKTNHWKGEHRYETLSTEDSRQVGLGMLGIGAIMFLSGSGGLIYLYCRPREEQPNELW